MNYNIRLIEPQDNQILANLVTTVLKEFGCEGPGYASSDKELLDLYEAYQGRGRGYFVIEDADTGTVLGGLGYSRLKGTSEEEGICELQKFYFSSQARGLGLGKLLLSRVIEAANADGYREVYLETLPQMETAVRLYGKFGFQRLRTNRGNTGHQYHCSVYMSRPLRGARTPALSLATAS